MSKNKKTVKNKNKTKVVSKNETMLSNENLAKQVEAEETVQTQEVSADIGEGNLKESTAEDKTLQEKTEIAEKQNNKEGKDNKNGKDNKKEDKNNKKQDKNGKQKKGKNVKDKPGLAKKAKDTFSELKKVTWPSFADVCKKTGVVLVVVLIFAVVIFGIDYCLGLLMGLLR